MWGVVRSRGIEVWGEDNSGNLIRLGDPACGIVTKTVHKMMTGCAGYRGCGDVGI